MASSRSLSKHNKAINAFNTPSEVSGTRLPRSNSNMDLIVNDPIESLQVTHLDHLLTDIGIWQHAIGSEPNKSHGYSIDDVARALIVALGYWQRGEHMELCPQMAGISLKFIDNAAIKIGPNAGRYHNFCDENGQWLDSIGSDDSFGRTLWALGVAVEANCPHAPAGTALDLFTRSLPVCDTLRYLRSIAFAIIGLDKAGIDKSRMTALADKLVTAYRTHSDEDWKWYEPMMTYCNARLPHALFAAASNFPDNNEYLQIAIESLDYLLRIMHNEKGSYSPIGNAPMSKAGWFNKGDSCPPLFDQQPVDAGALAECCAYAYQVTAEPRHRKAAHDAYAWYFGENIHGLMLYDPITGGVGDALTRKGINRNMGAESVLSLHLAHLALKTMEVIPPR